MNTLGKICEDLAQVELLLSYAGLDETAREKLRSTKSVLLGKIEDAGKKRVEELTRRSN